MEITKEELLSKIDGKINTSELAVLFGVSPTSIRYYLKKYNLDKKVVRKKPEWHDKIKDIVPQCMSIADVLRKLDLSIRPGNYTTVKLVIKQQNISTNHFLGRAHGTSKPKTTIPFDKILIENSDYVGRNKALKRRLISAGLIINKCQICKCDPIWNGKPLVLVLDHINGKNNDNRIENLRMLCPNCNSQEPTFCRGHDRLKRKQEMQQERKQAETCSGCGGYVWYKTETHLCQKCAGIRYRKVKVRPTKDELLSLMQTTPLTKIGQKFSVSSNTIKKWLKDYDMKPLFSRGEFNKKYYTKAPPPKEELEKLIQSGVPHKTIAKKYSTSTTRVEKWKKDYEISSLTNSEKSKISWRRLKEKRKTEKVNNIFNLFKDKDISQ